MKRIFFSPITWFVGFFVVLFREFIFFGKIPLPIDNLVGSYLPWLDYKWGYIVGVPVKNPLTSDAFSTFYVWKNLAIELIRQGIVPLWNRYSFSGTPLLASFHTAIFFPANILFLLPFDLGWGVFVFSSMLACAGSMYLFLGQFSQSKIGRFIGSLVYVLAGPMTTWSQFGTAAWAAALLPLLLYFLDKIISGKKVFLPLFSLIIGLLIFAGHVQLLTYSAIVAPLYFLYRQKKSFGKIKPSLSFTVLLFALIGLGLGAVQLFPTIDFFSHSIRGEENYARSFNYGLSAFSQIIRLWAADFFGNPVTINHFSSFSYHESSSYLGVLTLPLIINFLFSNDKKKKSVTFFTTLFFISLFLAFDNFVSRFIFSLPFPLLTYSSASRIFFLTNLSAAVLICLGIEHLQNHETSLTRVMFFSISLAVITLLAVTFVDAGHQMVSLRNAVYYVIVLVSFIGSGLFFHNRKVFICLLFLIMAVDLGRYYTKYNPFVSRNFIFPTTPIIDFLTAQKPPFRIAREDTNLIPANSWIAYRLESVEGYDPLFNSDYGHFFHRLSGNSYFNSVSRYALLDGVNQKFLSAVNVKYVITKNTTQSTAGNYLTGDLMKNHYQPVFTDKSVTIYEDPNVKPRAYFVNKLHFVQNKSEIGSLLNDPLFDPTNEAIIIEKPFDISSTMAKVTSIEYDGNQVELDVETNGQSFLVLADAFDPGWNGYIDGQRGKLYQVNGALRGVRVPSGKTQVIMKYEPRPFKYGLIVTSLSIILLIFSQIGLHLNKRR